MTVNKRIVVAVGITADGHHYAASTESPYFCFEGPSEKAVLDQVGRALAFYSKHTSERAAFRSKETTTSVTRLPASRFIQFDALEPA
jgi:hypothetical protein